MIFSTQIKKISSGKNPSLYVENEDTLDLYLFNNGTHKKQLIYSDILKCLATNVKYSYNSVIKLNEDFLCACFDDNMSVIKNEEN